MNSNNVKELRGTIKPSRIREEIVSFAPLSEYPSAPSWLSAHAAIEWNRLSVLLVNSKVLTEADVSGLAHLCQIHGEIVDAGTRRVEVPASLYAQLNAYYSAFGLTPLARQKLGRVKEEKSNNRFSKHARQLDRNGA